MKRSYLNADEDEDPDTGITLNPVGCGLTTVILVVAYVVYRLV